MVMEPRLYAIRDPSLYLRRNQDLIRPLRLRGGSLNGVARCFCFYLCIYLFICLFIYLFILFYFVLFYFVLFYFNLWEERALVGKEGNCLVEMRGRVRRIA